RSWRDSTASEPAVPMRTRVHPVGLVVRRLEDGLAFWQDTLGLRIVKQATVQDQGVRAALLPIGRSEIELLEPIDAAGGVAKFLARRGEGLHHVCFETPDVAAELAAARGAGLPLICDVPTLGPGGEGLSGLVLEVPDIAAASRTLGTPPEGDVHLDAARCHGVPLTFRAAAR